MIKIGWELNQRLNEALSIVQEPWKEVIEQRNDSKRVISKGENSSNHLNKQIGRNE